MIGHLFASSPFTGEEKCVCVCVNACRGRVEEKGETGTRSRDRRNILNKQWKDAKGVIIVSISGCAKSSNKLG